MIPHGPIDHAERYRLSKKAFAHKNGNLPPYPAGSLRASFTPLDLRSSTDSVVVTAFYREVADYAGKYLPEYAGHEAEYPFVIRMVEMNGEASDVTLALCGNPLRVTKTDLLGRPVEELELEACVDPPLNPEMEWKQVRFSVRPHEIVTLYADLEHGRKQPRDLDAKREIWATVHRVDEAVE